MKIYYYDTDGGSDKRQWAELIGGSATSLGWNVVERKFDPEPGIGVVFIHDSTLGFTERRAQDLLAKHPSLILIWISGGGLSGHMGNRFYAARQPVGKPTDPGFSKRVSQFMQALKEGKAPLFHLIDSNEGEFLAFRLLCEAYKLKKIDGKSDCGGIEIHAPEGIDQWLDPFGKKSGADSAATFRAIDEVSSLIGSGTIKDEAKAVLDAVNGSGKLDEAIDDFLEDVTKPTI